jgi:hypothetical protein
MLLLFSFLHKADRRHVFHYDVMRSTTKKLHPRTEGETMLERDALTLGPKLQQLKSHVVVRGLLNRTGSVGKDGVGVRADDSDCANHQHQDNCQHNCILRYVLTFVRRPQFPKFVIHE